MGVGDAFVAVAFAAIAFARVVAVGAGGTSNATISGGNAPIVGAGVDWLSRVAVRAGENVVGNVIAAGGAG